MEEIELKILEINKEDIVRKIIAEGGNLIEEGSMISYLYDNAAGEIKESKRLFRLREFAGRTFLTYKENIEKDVFVVNDEVEVDVQDIEKMRRILKSALIECVKDVRHRSSYRLFSSRIDIDSYDSVPPYMEIESPDKEELTKIVELLGYSMDDTTSEHYDEVLERYKNT